MSSNSTSPSPGSGASGPAGALAAALTGAAVTGPGGAVHVRHYRLGDGSLLRTESWPAAPAPAGAVEIDEDTYRREQAEVDAAQAGRQADADAQAAGVQRARYRELTGVGLSAELAASLAEYTGERE